MYSTNNNTNNNNNNNNNSNNTTTSHYTRSNRSFYSIDKSRSIQSISVTSSDTTPPQPVLLQPTAQRAPTTVDASVLPTEPPSLGQTTTIDINDLMKRYSS
jgi:sortase (surface protein transpeptidase)